MISFGTVRRSQRVGSPHDTYVGRLPTLSNAEFAANVALVLLTSRSRVFQSQEGSPINFQGQANSEQF